MTRYTGVLAVRCLVGNQIFPVCLIICMKSGLWEYSGKWGTQHTSYCMGALVSMVTDP